MIRLGVAEGEGRREREGGRLHPDKLIFKTKKYCCTTMDRPTTYSLLMKHANINLHTVNIFKLTGGFIWGPFSCSFNSVP